MIITEPDDATEPHGCLFCDRTTGPHDKTCPGYSPPVQPDLMSVSHHSENAELIRDCIQFYIEPRFGTSADAIDLTWGKGLWWKGTDVEARFAQLIRHTADMRDSELVGECMDAVFYDPPYVSVGGRATTTVRDFFERFGLGEAPKTPAQLQHLMNQGLEEACRIVRPKGFVFMKCTNYVSSGKLWTGVTDSIAHARTIPKMRVFDVIVHESGTGPQPLTDECRPCVGVGVVENGDLCVRCGGQGEIPRRKVHARNNASVLIIFEKGGRRARS